jgi:uncharacterized protein (TIRG00374 family)
LIVALAVSGACLYWATRGTDWEAVGVALRGAHVGWCLLVIAVSICCHTLRAERWRLLLRPVGRVPLWPAVAATFLGFGANAVLPLRLGELIRPAFLSRRVGIPLSPTISSIVLERIFDTLLVICCLLGVGLVYPVPELLWRGSIILGIGASVGLVVLVVMERNRAVAERLIRRVVDMLPARVGESVWSIATGLLNGLGGLNDLRVVALVLASSIGLWSLITLTYTLSFFAMDVPIPTVAGSLVTVVIVAASVFLPQAPGFIGTWQAGCVAALHGVFGVPQEIAVGFSLLTWVIQMTANVGSALVAIAIEGVSLRELRDETRGEVAET